LQRLAGPGASGRYIYERPRDAGAAAKIDAEQRRAATPNGPGADPVAGTGKPFKASSPEVNALMNDARKAGARCEPGGGHIAVIWMQDGKEVRKMIRSTPGGNAQRAVMQDRARLRREGLKV
jgi:hypothetical protein